MRVGAPEVRGTPTLNHLLQGHAKPVVSTAHLEMLLSGGREASSTYVLELSSEVGSAFLTQC